MCNYLKQGDDIISLLNQKMPKIFDCTANFGTSTDLQSNVTSHLLKIIGMVCP